MSCETKSGCCDSSQKSMHSTVERNDCSSPKMPSTGCEMTDMMMGLANKAWSELVIEKMKQKMAETHAEHIDKVAQAGVEAAGAYHMHKLEGKKKCEESKKKVKEAFMA